MITFDGTMKTEQNRNGVYQFKVYYHFHGFNVKNFQKLLSSLNLKLDSDKVVISETVLKQIITERTKEALKIVLDKFPFQQCVVKKDNGKVNDTLIKNMEKYVEDSIQKVGPYGNIKFVPISTYL